MSETHIILDNLPSVCQKLSDLVEVWRIYNKNNFVCFLRHGVDGWLSIDAALVTTMPVVRAARGCWNESRWSCRCYIAAGVSHTRAGSPRITVTEHWNTFSIRTTSTPRYTDNIPSLQMTIQSLLLGDHETSTPWRTLCHLHGTAVNQPMPSFVLFDIRPPPLWWSSPSCTHPIWQQWV